MAAVGGHAECIQLLLAVGAVGAVVDRVDLVSILIAVKMSVH